MRLALICLSLLLLTTVAGILAYCRISSRSSPVGTSEVEAPSPVASPAAPSIAVAKPPWMRALVDMAAWTEQGFSYQDPRFGQVAAAVGGHLPEAVDFWRTTTGRVYYRHAIGRVIVESVSDRDRDLVLAAVEGAPFLLTAVVDHQWTPAAREIIRRKLSDRPSGKLAGDEPLRSDEMEEWTAALASIATGEDLPVVLSAVNQLRTGTAQAKIIGQLRSCPGFDADAAIRGAWGVRYSTDYGDRQHGLVLMAARIGIREAFVTCGDALASPAFPSALKAELASWLGTQPACAGVAYPTAWFTAHERQFSFREGAWHLDPPPVETPIRVLVRAPQPIPDPPVPPPPPGLAADALSDAVLGWRDADAAALLGWLDVHAAEVKDLKTYSHLDPRSKAFAAIPPALFAELIASKKRYQTKWVMRALIMDALPQIVRQEHHDVVLANLETCPELIVTIVPHGWLDEATPIVRRMLATAALASLPKATVDAVRMMTVVSHPEDYALLGQTFLRTRYGYWQQDIAHALAAIPDFDLDPLVRTAWQQATESVKRGDRDALAIFAAKAGISEAMPIVVAYASDEKTGWNKDSLRQEAREYLAATFHVQPDKEAISQWWATAQPLLHWDEAKHGWSGPAPLRAPAGTNSF